jgi:hypothetical protein
MSVQIILLDLGDVLSDRSLKHIQSIKYQPWLCVQRKHAETHLHPDIVIHHHHQDAGPQLDYWGVTRDDIMTKPMIERALSIDVNTSSRIINTAVDVFEAWADELVAAALFYGFH